MIKVEKIALLNDLLLAERIAGKSIGFVPTMGALHLGHISLVEQAKAECDVVVVSIFVNPTQFNNKEDLVHYPRTLEQDELMLKNAGANILFTPDADEIYSGGEKLYTISIELGNLEKVMEGAHRPGHFKGVVQVVYRLFDIINPDAAYFGEKDFQQLSIIRHMVKQLGLHVRVVACPTVRENSGLAMSSRNLRLSEKEKQDAASISKSLFMIRDNWRSKHPRQLVELAKDFLSRKGLQVEYIEIADEETLEPLKDWNANRKARAFAAVHCGPVRLIDNVPVNFQQG